MEDSKFYIYFTVVLLGILGIVACTTQIVQPDGSVVTVSRRAADATVVAETVRACLKELPVPVAPVAPPAIDYGALAPEAQIAALFAKQSETTTAAFVAVIASMNGSAAGPCTSISLAWARVTESKDARNQALITMGLSLGIPGFFSYLNNKEDSDVLKAAFANSGRTVNIGSNSGNGIETGGGSADGALDTNVSDVSVNMGDNVNFVGNDGEQHMEPGSIMNIDSPVSGDISGIRGSNVVSTGPKGQQPPDLSDPIPPPS